MTQSTGQVLYHDFGRKATEAMDLRGPNSLSAPLKSIVLDPRGKEHSNTTLGSDLGSIQTTPSGITAARLASVRLYGADSEDGEAITEAALLIITCDKIIVQLIDCIAALDADDEIQADMLLMEAKRQSATLLELIYLSDGIGLLISCIVRTMSEIAYAKDVKDTIIELKRAITEASQKPNLSFARASELCDALENVSETPEFALLAELRSVLFADHQVNETETATDG